LADVPSLLIPLTHGLAAGAEHVGQILNHRFAATDDSAAPMECQHFAAGGTWGQRRCGPRFVRQRPLAIKHIGQQLQRRFLPQTGRRDRQPLAAFRPQQRDVIGPARRQQQRQCLLQKRRRPLVTCGQQQDLLRQLPDRL